MHFEPKFTTKKTQQKLTHNKFSFLLNKTVTAHSEQNNLTRSEIGRQYPPLKKSTNFWAGRSNSIANWLITVEQVIFRQKQVNPSEQKGNPDNTTNVNTPKPDIEHPQIAMHHRETQSLKLRLRWSLDSLQQVRYQERNKSSDGKATR